MGKKLENIAKGPPLTRAQMEFKIAKVKSKSFFEYLGSIKACLLQRYYELRYGYNPKKEEVAF